MNTSYSVRPTPDQLVNAALANEPIDLPIEYQFLAGMEGREEIVATRLARNIGPLLGVPNPEGPFGDMSWLSDFATLTLNEIARGAPEVTRGELQQLRKTGDKPTSGWQWIGRAVYGKPPNEIVNASLNPFGLHTKAAVTLTGLNRLLEPQTQAVAETIQSNAFRGLETEQKLQVYGNMIFGAYRPQPLAVHTGLQSRVIQRAHASGLKVGFSSLWEELGTKLTPSESPPPERPASRQPLDLALIDTTARHLTDVLPWPQQVFNAPAIVADSLVNLLLTSYKIGWEEYNDAPGQRRIRATQDPAIISSKFADQILPVCLSTPQSPVYSPGYPWDK